MLGVMKQMQAMQEKMQALQTELENTEVEGTSGGGLVTVRLTAKGEMRGVQIDASLMKSEEKDILEDLILAAHNDAKAKGEQLTQEKMGRLTAGLPLPPGLKLPF